MAVSSRDEDERHSSSAVHEGPGVSQEKEEHTVLLSTSQIILRRGLTTLAALLILAVGIAVHLNVPLPEVSYSANATSDSNITTTSPTIRSTSVFS